MPAAASQMLNRMEQQLHGSQRNLRLYFAIGGGLLALGLLGGPSGILVSGSQYLQALLFLAGSIGGFLGGSLLQRLAMPSALKHVHSLLIDGLLLVQLLDSPEENVPSQPVRRSLFSPAGNRARGSMALRLDWIVNNWSIIIHRMGYSPLPARIQRLHHLYLLLIICVPVAAVLSHNVYLLFALGSVYVLGLALDSIECDAVRAALLDALRGEG